ncbi:uncharacterized protein HIPP1 [Eurosta solidaginis]|uniref:uncharacterized protein HIPP1 n=1 Tax=Eurosta solidaginis TaxID=178769 RepID=UPI003530DCBA
MSTKEYDSSAEEFVKTEKCEDSNDGTAKIISNELLVGVHSGAEKIDELTSLEREIAKMHHVGPSSNLDYLEGGNYDTGDSGLNNQNLVAGDRDADSKSDYPNMNELEITDSAENVEFMKGDREDETNVIKEENGSTALEHEDLIAVLKGIDDHSIPNIKGEKDGEQKNRPPSVTESELAEGVTIEGEGQFQIMDVVYDELEDEPASRNESHEASGTKPSTCNAVPHVISSGITHLTNEEIRAMAMEQMAGLKSIVVDRQRKRKQDIKPLQVDDSADLVTSLGADWSEDDAEADIKASTSLSSSKKSNIKTELTNKKHETKIETTPQNINGKELSSKASDPIPIVSKLENIDESVSDSTRGETAVTTDQAVKNENTDLKPIVGFKRTRIIKRKIIWDPDAPETQISFAQFARNRSRISLEANNQPAKTSTQKTSGVSVLKNPNNRQNDQILRRSDSKISSTSAVSKSKRASMSPLNIHIKEEIPSVTEAHSPVKRRSQTPIINGNSSGSKKKRVSEIDRLVSDEGAANMLHSLESERNKLVAEQGVDKPHKPLMRSRAATISERILKRETTPTPAKVTPTASTSGGGKNKRYSKQKPSSTWDFVYKQKASEDAMIIRRRSNSSYSSNASVRRLSIDAPISKSTSGSKTTFTKRVQQNTISDTAASGSAKASGSKTTQRSLLKSSNETSVTAKETGAGINTKASLSNSFEFIKPEMKSNQKGNRRLKGNFEEDESYINDIKKAITIPGARKGSRSPATVDDKDKNRCSVVSSKASTKHPKEESSPTSNASDVVVKKISKVGQIVFNTQKAKINYTFTAQMLNKLVDILDKLGKDTECNAVLMTTTAPNFCFGIDFTDLTSGTAEKRKLTALHLATAVKKYLKALATFPKPLIAGVNGSCAGLGVMQLPLFDIVIGSDKGSYETPYIKIGQVPEGYCFWNNTTKIRDNYKTKLLWLGEKLHSTESALSGLVHKLTASSKVNDDSLQTAKKVAMMSTESYRFMKQSVVNNHLETINNVLDEEFDTIIEQWTSAECYDNFKKYLESGHF